MRNRFVATVAVAAVAALGLAACGSGTTPEEPAAAPNTSLATTASWWLVRRAHAARDKKLTVWVPTALAPQVDKILQEQCYAYE